MCRAFEEVRNETREETLLETIRNMIKKIKITAQQAMEMMDMPLAEQEKLLAKI